MKNDIISIKLLKHFDILKLRIHKRSKDQKLILNKGWLMHLKAGQLYVTLLWPLKAASAVGLVFPEEQPLCLLRNVHNVLLSPPGFPIPESLNCPRTLQSNTSLTFFCFFASSAFYSFMSNVNVFTTLKMDQEKLTFSIKRKDLLSGLNNKSTT